MFSTRTSGDRSSNLLGTTIFLPVAPWCSGQSFLIYSGDERSNRSGATILFSSSSFLPLSLLIHRKLHILMLLHFYEILLWLRSLVVKDVGLWILMQEFKSPRGYHFSFIFFLKLLLHLIPNLSPFLFLSLQQYY